MFCLLLLLFAWGDFAGNLCVAFPQHCAASFVFKYFVFPTQQDHARPPAVLPRSTPKPTVHDYVLHVVYFYIYKYIYAI